MKLTFKLALKAKGLTNPNPMVGCVIVNEGEIVGYGYHKRAGFPHAEIEAIKKARDRAKGAVLYVNLEPCAHYGRTPPCTEEIISAGIKKVYTAMIDPNPLNNGKGIEELQKNGVEVEVGILEEGAKKLNEVFIKYITQKIPFVTVKVAQSLDGKIATKSGDSKWITSEKSRQLAKGLRDEVDAIMVGVNTIIKDDPLLNPKSEIWNLKSYYKIILDSNLRIPLEAKIFSKESMGKVILATTKYAPQEKIDLFRKKAEVWITDDKEGRVDLNLLIQELGRREISHVLIEGGGETIAAAFEAGVVDKVYFFISPKIIGGKSAITSVKGKGIEKLEDVIKLKDIIVKRIDEDILVSGYIRK